MFIPILSLECLLGTNVLKVEPVGCGVLEALLNISHGIPHWELDFDYPHGLFFIDRNGSSMDVKDCIAIRTSYQPESWPWIVNRNQMSA